NARRIQKYNLSLRTGIDSLYPVSCGLRLVGCDGNLLPNEMVHQGGFPHVGPADQGRKAGFKFCIFHIYNSFSSLNRSFSSRSFSSPPSAHTQPASSTARIRGASARMSLTVTASTWSLSLWSVS